MFENLQEKLQRAFKNLRGQGTLTEENIQEALKEIRMALLEADVNFKVVKEFIDRIQAKAVGQEVMTALSPANRSSRSCAMNWSKSWARTRPSSSSRRSRRSVILMAGLAGFRQNHHLRQDCATG